MFAAEFGLNELLGLVIEFPVNLIGSCPPTAGLVVGEVAAIPEAGVVAFDFSGNSGWGDVQNAGNVAERFALFFELPEKLAMLNGQVGVGVHLFGH